MERSQVLVVAAAVAVVGVFVVKVLSNQTALDDEGLAGDRPAASAADPAPSEGTAGGSGASRSAHRRFDTAAALRAATGGGSAGRPAGAPSAAGAIGGSDRRARPGEPAGGTIREGGAALAAKPGSVDVPASRAQRRADVMDMLAQPSSTGSDSPAKSGEGEVALEVRGTADSDQASHREDIDDPADGSDGIKFTDGSQLTFAQAGGASGESGTITFDVEPEWSGGDATDNSLVQIRNENEWANRLQLVKNGRFLRFILADDTGREADISVPIDEWQPGQPHSVTASWGDGQTSLFIDGRLAGSNTYQGAFNIAPTTPLHLGSDFPSSDYGGANATIRGFTLFKKAQHP